MVEGPWTVRKRRYPVALHVDRFSRRAAQSVQQREMVHAVQQGRDPFQYRIGQLYRPFDPDIDTLFVDEPANGLAEDWQSASEMFSQCPASCVTCRTVKHLALNTDSIHFWITAEREVKPVVQTLFWALEHISIVENWPSWPTRSNNPDYYRLAAFHTDTWARGTFRMKYIELEKGWPRHTVTDALLRTALRQTEPSERPYWRGNSDTWPILLSLCGPHNDLGFGNRRIKISIARIFCRMLRIRRVAERKIEARSLDNMIVES